MTMPNTMHDRLRQRRERRSSGGWKPKEGANKVRILPPRSKYIDAWETMEDLAVSAKIHFFRVEGKPATVSRCLEELKQKCPACDAWRTYRKSADPGFAERAKQIAPADQYFFNIIDVNDLKAGVQAWAANYTCWDKILEVAANPAWGNVVNPADGINFDVTLTPGKSSRTGFNSYSVMPDPQRNSVMNILEATPDWKKSLDTLDEHIPAARTVDEINDLLEEMGFPVVRRLTPGAAPATSVSASTPGPITVPTGLSAPVVAAVAPVTVGAPVALAAPVPLAAPVALAAPAALAPPIAQQAAPAAVQAVGASAALHYDPGPAYAPVVPEAQRPDGAPRCFGDFDPKVHQCRPCPAIVDCQMKLLDSPLAR